MYEFIATESKNNVLDKIGICLDSKWQKESSAHIPINVETKYWPGDLQT